MDNLKIGHIYKITCKLDKNIFYIGSTFTTIEKRFKQHKKDFKTKKLSISIYFDKYGIDNFSISLIKSYNVIRTHNKDFKHLHVYEQLWINKLKKCCNQMKVFNPIFKSDRRNQDKIYNSKQSTKDKKKIYNKMYNEKNYNDIKLKQKEYENREETKKKRREYEKTRLKDPKRLAYMKAYRERKKLESSQSHTTPPI